MSRAAHNFARPHANLHADIHPGDETPRLRNLANAVVIFPLRGAQVDAEGESRDEVNFSGEPDDDPKTRMRSNDDAYRIVLAAIFTSDFRR